MKLISISLITLLFLFVGIADAAEKVEIDFSQLPLAVQETALGYTKQESITHVEATKGEENTIYELEMIINGVSTDVTVTQDGSVLEIGKAAKVYQLSTEARRAIEKNYPGIKVTQIESVQSFYTAIEGTVDGRNVQFNIFATGDIEDDNACEHKDPNTAKSNPNSDQADNRDNSGS